MRGLTPLGTGPLDSGEKFCFPPSGAKLLLKLLSSKSLNGSRAASLEDIQPRLEQVADATGRGRGLLEKKGVTR